MPNVSRTRASTAAARSRSQPKRFVALKKLENAIKKAGRPWPEAKLEILDYHRYSTPNGTALSFYVDDRDEKKMGVSYSVMTRVMIDDKNKEFYFQGGGDNNGPFKLPRGVKAADLFDDGTVISRGKTKYEKSISKLMHAVQDGMHDAVKDGNTNFDYDQGAFQSPTGEAMYHHYIDFDPPDRSNAFHMPGGALMLGKTEFWVEQIPGVSGNCIGPFDYPPGFDLKDIKAKDTRDARAADRASASDSVDNDSGSSRRRSVVIGSDSGNYSPAPRRTGSGGSAGRSPAYWRPS